MWDGIYSSRKESFLHIWHEPKWEKAKKVSVVVTCHGGYGKYLVKCLDSVYSQTYPNIEVILCDDDTDNLPDITQYNLRYFKVNYHTANKTRNFGFTHTTGKYVLFLDADDRLLPDTISKYVYYMEREDVSVVGGQIQRVDLRTGQKLETSPVTATNDLEALFISNFIQTSALIRRKDFIGFDESISQFQDWDLWMRMYNASKKILHLPTVTLIYGVHGHNNQGYGMSFNDYKQWYRRVLYKDMALNIVTLFSGKSWCFNQYFKRLSELTFPKNHTRLIFYNDSNDKRFTALLNKKVKKIRSRYKEVVVLSGAVKPAGYEPFAVPAHITKVYNAIRYQMIKGSHCFIWEDDILPPKDIIQQLTDCLWEDVGIVSGYANARQFKLPLAWNWDKDEKDIYQAYPNGKDVEEIGAVSLGCTLVPTYFIRTTEFKVIEEGKGIAGHDIVFSRAIADAGFKVLINWKAKCLHLDKNGVITPSIKLHLGCGYDYRADYVNIDQDPHSPADVHMNLLTQRLPYPDDVVDEIETHHFIEHLDVPLGDDKHLIAFTKIFSDWHRVMKKNARLIIECPDFDGLVQLYSKKKDDSLLKHFYGCGGEGHHHFNGWNFSRLEKVLKNSGFEKIEKKKAKDFHAKVSPCLRVEAIKGAK